MNEIVRKKYKKRDYDKNFLSDVHRDQTCEENESDLYWGLSTETCMFKWKEKYRFIIKWNTPYKCQKRNKKKHSEMGVIVTKMEDWKNNGPGRK